MGLVVPLTFDLAGIAAALLGGDDATSAMSTVLFSKQLKWTRWYNTPGCFDIARQYSMLARYGVAASSVEDRSGFLAVLGGERGSKFKALHSGTIIEKTEHIAHLLEKDCETMQDSMMFAGRKSTPSPVTVITLGNPRPSHFSIEQEKPPSALDFLPVIASVSAFLICVAASDYYNALVILAGILANGVSGLLLSSMTIALKSSKSAEGSPPGDGFLLASQGVIVLRGKEESVAGITRGRLELCSSNDLVNLDKPIPYLAFTRSALYFGICSLLFTVQFLIQLALVNHGTTFGRIMLLMSLAVAWLQNFGEMKLRILSNSSKSPAHGITILECPQIHAVRFSKSESVLQAFSGEICCQGEQDRIGVRTFVQESSFEDRSSIQRATTSQRMDPSVRL